MDKDVAKEGERRMLNIFLIIGLIGALLMFMGDMVLYYSKDDYVSDGTLNPIIEIMKEESRGRLYAGGIIGPLAAFVYCIGYYHLVLVMNEQYQTMGWICFFINCLGIICGGAYHSHCAYLGLITRHDAKVALEEIHKYLNVQKVVAFGLQGIGFLLLAIYIVLQWTIFPWWVAMFSPGILFLLFPFTRKLQKGLHMIIGGGWTNLISVIYYGVALIVVL